MGRYTTTWVKSEDYSDYISDYSTATKPDPEDIFIDILKKKYKITGKQLREMMKIHYPEHLI